MSSDEVYFRTKWRLHPSSRLATIDGPKIGWGGCAFSSGVAGSPSNTKSPGPRPTSIPSGILVHPAPFWGELGPHPAQCCLGRGLPPYQVPSWCIKPFGHNRHGAKIGGLCPFWGNGAGSPSNTMSLGPRPTSLSSGILIHPAIWPQQIWAENWGCSCVPL